MVDILNFELFVTRVTDMDATVNYGRCHAGILICIFKIFDEFLKDAQSSQGSHGDKSMMDLSLSAVTVSRNTDILLSIKS